MSTYSKDSAQLEREVEEQRNRIESRIGEIRERLSPGQIVDELLSYTKTGGENFAANLGQTVANNPLPATLLGVSLVWLMSGQGPKLSAGQPEPATRQYRQEYPYATVSGGMRRISHRADDTGDWYSEFEDNSGKRFKAASNELGHRASEFIDDSGRKFSGFIDDTGNRIRDFQDEAGNRLDEAMGWAAHTLHDVKHGVTDTLDAVGQQVANQAQHLGSSAQQLGSSAQRQVDRTSRMAMDMFQNQPLVAGALAFAAGAALGAALPHTDQEDQAVGKLSDKVKRQAADVASDVYEDGKARAAELYEDGKEGAAQVYGEGRDTVTERLGTTDLH